jgi:hypothetical protein
MKYFLNILIRNNITKSIIKKIIPIKLRRFILININKDNSIKLYYGNNVAIIDSRPLAKVAKGIKIGRHS